MTLPNFFIAGAPKAGTTALHAALARHPQLFLPAVKEPKYFLCDGPPPERGGPGDAHSYREWVWRPEDYEALFEPAPPDALVGESTPFYLSDADALWRISRAVPDARLIAVLRDPVDRAYSNWAHLWADGLETIGDFMTACREEERRKEAGWAPFWRYLETGLYGRQLERVFELFPREHVHVIRYRSLVDEAVPTIDAVCRFLGVEEGRIPEVPPQNVGTYVAPGRRTRVLNRAMRAGAAVGSLFPPQVWRRASVPLLRLIQRDPRHRPELDPHDRAALVGYFAEDTVRLEELIGWDVSDWRSYRSAGTYSVRRSWAPSRRLAS